VTTEFYFVFGHLLEMVIYLLKLSFNGTLEHLSQSHKIVDRFNLFQEFQSFFVILNLTVIHEAHNSLNVEIIGKLIIFTFLLFLRIAETKNLILVLAL
jgi:hypothetical protein